MQEVVATEDRPSLLTISHIPDERGSLRVLQEPELPFVCRRIYWLSNFTEGTQRGHHGHLRLRQVMVAVNGSVTVDVEPLESGAWPAETFRLASGGPGLYIPAKSWRVLRGFSSDAVVLVLASEVYDPSDYVRVAGDPFGSTRIGE